MRTPRFFHPEPLSEHDEIVLGEAVFRHAVTVLRLPIDAPLILFDGHGGEYDATLIAIEKKRAIARLGEHRAREVESPLRIVLGQAIAKGDRMDYALQKAVELGVDTIVPLTTTRGAVRLDAERAHRKMNHWRGIVVGACEQCGRNRLPALLAPRSLADWLESVEQRLRLVLAPSAERPLRGLTRETDIALLIGPEGGLDTTEIDRACAHGFVPIGLGPRVLRTETAGMAALALLQGLWGDLG